MSSPRNGRQGRPKRPKGRPPNCLKCVHYFVTWDKNFPRGCRAFGVKTRSMPSESVYRATGRHCPAFSPSPKIKD